MSAIDPELQAKLDKAARLQKRITFRKSGTRVLEKRLELLRDELARLVPAASGAEAFATPTKGGGVSYNLAAAGGAIVRVTQPAAKLLGKIEAALAEKITELIGRKIFARLFVTHYTCAKNIRVLALQQLEKEKAEKLIAMVEEPSVATVTIS